MEQQRYAETGRDFFFGDYLCDQVVPQDHFLRKLKQEIDWGRFTHRLIHLPHSPVPSHIWQGAYGCRSRPSSRWPRLRAGRLDRHSTGSSLEYIL